MKNTDSIGDLLGEKENGGSLADGVVLGYVAPANQYTCSFVLFSVLVDFLTGQEVGSR